MEPPSRIRNYENQEEVTLDPFMFDQDKDPITLGRNDFLKSLKDFSKKTPIP